jgi:antitoxin component YwqK of YwqJK toxin-antitoxin module
MEVIKASLTMWILALVSCTNPAAGRSEVIQRFDDGKPKILCQYVGTGANERASACITYNQKGQVVLEEDLLAQTMKKTVWYAKGSKRSEQVFKDGKLHGRSREWYSNGEIKEERDYSENQLLRAASYKTTIGAETFYRDGELSIHREYDTGVLISETMYEHGKISKISYFYADGRISDEREYRDGQPHGRWTYWDRNGEKRNEVFYCDGQTVSKK